MLQITDLTYDAWGRRFFDGASVSLGPGSKTGLVGRNGAGKSTLFKLILGELTPGAGEIATPRGWRLATVDQEIAASPQLLIDAVLERDRRRATLLDALEGARPEEQGELHEALRAIGAERAPARAAEILVGLGFRHQDLSRPISDFSGGWRMRAALAGAILAEPDLLLLDEPTNYLDLEGALWLEQKLRRYPNAALLISHDRELLNRSVGQILHLRDGRLDLYAGGYDSFERQRAEKMRLQAAFNQKQDAERKKLQAFVDRFRAKASKASQAQSRLKRLEKLEPSVAVAVDRSSPFLLPSPAQALAPPLLRMTDVAVGYGGDPPILRRLNLRLDLDDRIGLLGVNGAGKSTLAKLLAGALTPSAGELWRDRRMKVGWFHQHQIEALDPSETPLDMIRKALPEATESQRRARLGGFGFDAGRAETRSLDLSGGERARLLLNIVAMEAPHLLILDEPTNHLDIDSRTALLEALNGYEGAVLLITHDRSLMELVADRLWLTADGAVTPFDGDMDDYARLVLERARNAAGDAGAPGGSGPRPGASEGPASLGSGKDLRRAAAEARQRLAPLKKAVEAAEAAIDRATREMARIDALLADPALFSRNPRQAVELGKARAREAEKLQEAEAHWLEAAEAYEAARLEA